MSQADPSSDPPPSATPPAGAMDRRLPRKRFRPGRVVMGVAAAAFVTVIAVLIWRTLPGSGELVVNEADLATATAQQAIFEDALPVRAVAAPLRTVQIVAIEGGQVQNVQVEDGARLTAGQPLAILSNPRLRMEVTASEAQIAGQLGDARGQQLQISRSRLDREQAISETAFNLLNAERELGIRSSLHAKGIVSDAGLAESQALADYHRNRLQSLRRAEPSENQLAQRQLEGVLSSSNQLQSNLSAVRASLDALTIRAPVAGRLTAFDLQPGQPLTAGAVVGQIDSEDAYKLVAEVDEFYLARVSTGQGATATLEGKTWPLAVSRVLPQVANGRFTAELVFRGATPPNLRRGQTLDLRITLGESRPALVLPTGAWLEGSGGAFVYVLDADGRRATRRAVRLGRRSPTQVEVLQGLAAHDRIVASSYAAFDARPRLVLR
ncbi:efflux RND transporter periplasmic adaptor subunit [Brevundimonas sp. SL130]|uniref:efflux RND transporter periplasmic adaptor subunit n=1 Tax=Brevundimonas sp. SL130 TaxID=2995143 RepID=UPI00226D2713|nr:efflux RND transporter periplasmic adaptor subunit [Brevundimonas sp. SL130]WAC61345.1 efflux RND transporter periplasmic adaptor subunit [Brevundimonas sp. SL130]